MPQIDKEKLEQYANVVFDRLNYFNDYTLQTIGRRIKAVGKLSAYDQQALKNMADISGDMKGITKKLAEITKQNVDNIKKIYKQTISDGVNTYKPLYDLKNMDFVPFEHNEFAKQLVRHWVKETTGEMINLSRTKALCFDKYNCNGDVVGSNSLEGAFQKAIDDAVIALSDGRTDFNTAMRETIKNLGGGGVKVHYGSGVNRSLSAMIRQNLLYGAKQSAQAYDNYIGEKLSCDGFEVDAHSGCRPTHEFMQGQLYSYSGEKTVDGATYKDGTDALIRLGDYGCLHFKSDIILGVSESRYSQKELNKIHEETTKLIEYDGKKKTLYQWKQVQRRLECAVRNKSSIRDMAKASGDNVLAKDCDANIKAFRYKYDDLCNKVGLSPKIERMVSYSNKPLDNSGKSGIIKMERNIASRNMAIGLRKPPTHILSDDEIMSIKEDIKAIGADENVFIFNKGHYTGYNDKTDKIKIRGDILPEKSSQHPRDLMSPRAVIAHEYYGHRMYKGTILDKGSWNDEFRASYMAAKNTPNLNDSDRRYLVLDALERAREKGVTIKNNDFIRRTLYGY